MEKYIILHGSFGSNEGNWFTWLKKNYRIGIKKFLPHKCQLA